MIRIHSPVSELCERITVCKWMYSCKHVISVSSQPCEKTKAISKQFTYWMKVGHHISLNNIQGWLFLFSHQKGVIIRRKTIIRGRQLFQKLDPSEGTGKLCSFGNLRIVFIWSCFVSCVLFLLFYVSLCNLCSGTHCYYELYWKCLAIRRLVAAKTPSRLNCQDRVKY